MWGFLRPRFGSFRDKKIHLGAPFTLLMDLEHHRHRSPESHWRERSQQIGVLGFIPFRREPIRGTNEELIPLDLEGLCRFQPRLEGLLRHLLARPLEQTRPGFLCGKSHDRLPVWKTRGAAKLRGPCGNRNDSSARRLQLDLCHGVGYVYRPSRITFATPPDSVDVQRMTGSKRCRVMLHYRWS